MVHETDGVYLTREDVAGLVQPGEIEDVVPEGGVLKDYGILSVENLPGYFVDYGVLRERAGVAIYQGASGERCSLG
ncbi:MAG: hypothetical protein SWN10_23965 [Pseudomonadota bacterium]|nr:hypothetical protein [Pseudomonadota bacterium]